MALGALNIAKILAPARIKALKREPKVIRKLAAMVGTVIWRLYIYLIPLIDGHEVLAISSQVGKHARTHGWDAKIDISASCRNILEHHLALVRDNPWTQVSSLSEHNVFYASDASEERGAWVHFSETGKVLDKVPTKD